MCWDLHLGVKGDAVPKQVRHHDPNARKPRSVIGRPPFPTSSSLVRPKIREQGLSPPITPNGVEQGKVIFGITSERNDARHPSVAELCDTPILLQKETVND